MENDLISRQAAMDAIRNVPPGNWSKARYLQEIEKLPAAEPKIIRCKDCKHFQEMQIQDLTEKLVYYRPKISCWGDENGFCSRAERKEEPHGPRAKKIMQGEQDEGD